MSRWAAQSPGRPANFRCHNIVRLVVGAILLASFVPPASAVVNAIHIVPELTTAPKATGCDMQVDTLNARIGKSIAALLT